jgi:RimJ/RimL family protein N-acetyltransferase
LNRKKYIENDILCFAKVIESDYKILYDSWNDEDTVWGYNYKLPYTFDEYRKKGEKNSNWGAIIIRLSDNQIIGRIGISAGLPDLSITIFKAYRKQKYGTMAFLLGIKYCFEALNLDKIYAGSYEDNITSRKMIERCGFKPNPDGNVVDPHIFSGEDRLQFDFIIKNPRRNTENE